MKRECKNCFWLMAIICCCLCLTACERIFLSEEESYLTAEINSKEYNWKKINPFQESAGHSEYKFKLRMLELSYGGEDYMHWMRYPTLLLSVDGGIAVGKRYDIGAEGVNLEFSYMMDSDDPEYDIEDPYYKVPSGWIEFKHYDRYLLEGEFVFNDLRCFMEPYDSDYLRYDEDAAYVSYHDMSGQFHLEYYAVED